MPDILLDDGSHIDYPVLLLVNPAAAEEKLSLKGVLKGNNKTRGEFPLLFTDSDLADHCRESNPALVSYATIELRTPQEASAFLDAAEKEGCGYVGFYRTGKRARFISLAEIRKRIIG